MENNHTSGKWYVSDIKQDDGEYIYSDTNQFSAIARVYKDGNPHKEQAEANAKLMAAAPDLLEALKPLMSLFLNETNYPEGTIGYTLKQQAIKAIEKATK